MLKAIFFSFDFLLNEADLFDFLTSLPSSNFSDEMLMIDKIVDILIPKMKHTKWNVFGLCNWRANTNRWTNLNIYIVIILRKWIWREWEINGVQSGNFLSMKYRIIHVWVFVAGDDSLHLIPKPVFLDGFAHWFIFKTTSIFYWPSSRWLHFFPHGQ